MKIKGVIAIALMAITLAPSFLAMAPVGWEPPDPVRIYATDGTGWVEQNGIDFQTKQTQWGLRIVSNFSVPLQYLASGETATFSMNLHYAGSIANVMGTIDGDGNVTITSTSPNFATLAARFNTEHPEAIQAYNAHVPETFFDCMRAVGWGLLASAAMVAGCTSGNPYYCAAGIMVYARGLKNIADNCTY